MDILIGFDNEKTFRKDFSGKWNHATRLGLANAGENFTINGELGGNRRGEWDSSDRIKFSLLEPLTLTLNLDFQTIAEIVKFDSGSVSVIGSVEYGDRLQVELTPGRYGLSFFVEGDLINYSVNGQFSAIDS